MNSTGTKLFPCALLLVTLAIVGDGWAEEGGSGLDVGVGLSIGSDYVFRGVSQTLGAPAVQASVDVELDRGLYASLWGSNVDFMPDGYVDDGASLELNAIIGFAADLSDQWSVDAMLAGYFFPGAIDGINYDYAELITTFWYAGSFNAGVAYSPNVFGTDDDGLTYFAGAQQELGDVLTLEAGFGYYDLTDAYGADYTYVDVAIGRSYAAATITLSYHNTFGDAPELFFEQNIGERFVLFVDFYF